MDVSANKGGGDDASVIGAGDDAYVIGVDFGTLSARALVVRVRDGAEAGTAVSEYSHGVIDRSLDGHGELPPDWALQDPADYIRALGEADPAAGLGAGLHPARGRGARAALAPPAHLPVRARRTRPCRPARLA